MKQFFLYSLCVLLVGCATTDPVIGVDTTKKLEIDERLLQKPQIFLPRANTVLTEFEVLVEYAELAKAYNGCFNQSSALINLLEGSNLVLKVPHNQNTFSSGDQSSKGTK